MSISCECGGDWVIRYDLSGYSGEIVLRCDACGETYYNAQEFFDENSFESLAYVCETKKEGV